MPKQNKTQDTVLEHPSTTAIKEQEIEPLKQRVDKCYSTEDYKRFQKDVEEIVLKTVDSADGRVKVKIVTEEYFKGKIVWSVLIWLLTLVVGVLAQKFFGIF